MKIILFFFGAFCSICLSGCATYMLGEHAKGIKQSLTVRSVEKVLYEDGGDTYICFKGIATDNSSKQNSINYNDNVLRVSLKEVPLVNGGKYEKVVDRELLSIGCEEFSNLDGSLRRLPVYVLSKFRECEKEYECHDISWTVSTNEKVIGSGVFRRSEHQVSDWKSGYIEQLVFDELKKQESFDQAVLVSDIASYRHLQKKPRQFIYYLNASSAKALHVELSDLSYKKPKYPLYILMPVTVAWDVVTGPIQVIVFIVALKNSDMSGK